MTTRFMTRLSADRRQSINAIPQSAIANSHRQSPITNRQW
jgi:hypothetical protein